MSRQTKSKRSGKDGSVAGSQRPIEALEEMSSIRASEDGDFGADGIEEGASRRGGASGKDKSRSKQSYIDKNALLRGEISNIDAERSQRGRAQQDDDVASKESLDLGLDREALYRRAAGAPATTSKASQKASQRSKGTS